MCEKYKLDFPKIPVNLCQFKALRRDKRLKCSDWNWAIKILIYHAVRAVLNGIAHVGYKWSFFLHIWQFWKNSFLKKKKKLHSCKYTTLEYVPTIPLLNIYTTILSVYTYFLRYCFFSLSFFIHLHSNTTYASFLIISRSNYLNTFFLIFPNSYQSYV